MNEQARELNIALHNLFGPHGLPACETACTHYIWGTWTALGLANVAARAAAASLLGRTETPE